MRRDVRRGARGTFEAHLMVTGSPKYVPAPPTAPPYRYSGFRRNLRCFLANKVKVSLMSLFIQSYDLISFFIASYRIGLVLHLLDSEIYDGGG